MSTAELEYRLLYSMVVAGKSATFADAAMRRFFGLKMDGSPFGYVRIIDRNGNLGIGLRAARTGNYAKLEKGFREAANSALDLRRCKTEQLLAIHGIGAKTAKFFILWTRPDADCAALDTHVLKWLRFIGHDAPKSTPSGEKYARLEKIVLDEAKARGMRARELDSAIWDWCSAGNHRDGEWPANLQRLLPC